MLMNCPNVYICHVAPLLSVDKKRNLAGHFYGNGRHAETIDDFLSGWFSRSVWMLRSPYADVNSDPFHAVVCVHGQVPVDKW